MTALSMSINQSFSPVSAHRPKPRNRFVSLCLLATVIVASVNAPQANAKKFHDTKDKCNKRVGLAADVSLVACGLLATPPAIVLCGIGVIAIRTAAYEVCAKLPDK